MAPKAINRQSVDAESDVNPIQNGFLKSSHLVRFLSNRVVLQALVAVMKPMIIEALDDRLLK